ncbi:MAG: hypothetical protein ACR2RF_28300 [Geminicoccaceae bacterium]
MAQHLGVQLVQNLMERKAAIGKWLTSGMHFAIGIIEFADVSPVEELT